MVASNHHFRHPSTTPTMTSQSSSSRAPFGSHNHQTLSKKGGTPMKRVTFEETTDLLLSSNNNNNTSFRHSNTQSQDIYRDTSTTWNDLWTLKRANPIHEDDSSEISTENTCPLDAQYQFNLDHPILIQFQSTL